MFGISDIRLAFDAPWAGAWLLLAAACTAIGLTILSFRGISERLDRPLLLRLIALRLGAVAALLLAMFRPAISFEKRSGEKPAIAVCVDNSKSMGISDVEHRPARFHSVRNLLCDDGGLYARLAGDCDVSLFLVGAATARLDGPRALLRAVPDGEITALGDTVAAAASQVINLSRIILFTDGADNSGADPVPKLAALGVPVDCVVVGSALTAGESFADIAISDVRTPRRASADELTEISVYVRSSGFPGETADVSLIQESRGQGAGPAEARELVRQTFRLENRRGDQEVKLRFAPGKIGVQTYKVRIALKPGEKIRENNESEFLLQVTEPRIKVLYADIPRGESKYLGRLLLGDPHINAILLIRTGPGRFMQRGDASGIKLDAMPETRDAMDRFDVFIIGSLEAKHLSPAACRNLRERIEAGAGLLMIAGEGSFGAGGWHETPLAQIMPVRMGGGDPVESGKYSMVLTAAGRAHPAMSGMAGFFPAPDAAPAEALQPLELFNVTRGTEPAAEALAVRPDRKGAEDNRPLPVVAVVQAGKGRTAAVTGGPTWPWFTVQSGAGRATPYHKFWGQLIRWLASEEAKSAGSGSGPLAAWTDRAHYRPGERVTIYAQVRDAMGRTVSDAAVSAALAGPGGFSGTLTLTPGEECPGEYEAGFVPPAPGSYEATVSASGDGNPAGSVRLRFAVGRPSLEFERPDADDRLPRRISEATGGTCVRLSEADALVSAIKEKERHRRRRFELRLYDSPILFAAFVALVTAEWILRRRNELP
ncbi:MAG: hypothetical protein N3A38_05390 [Planctomycetota bacterium]|nr:hypothetical protein [Planctomycetota bacterium]